ncbi:hypothetical protein [Streptomyces fragilis]|uniref:Lipoprotein n=1 Tax=Streptomyces fragilis TaxID=67301 RepID=A0ABV2YLQ7_9ACTN|nr:hypothetical protein [Streptomyces fragilis]
MRLRSWRAAVAAAVVLAAGVGCDAGGEQLSLAGLTGTADAVPEDGADTCPLPYDIAGCCGRGRPSDR